MAFVRLLGMLVKDKEIGKHIVPIIPDEARTFGMEGLFRQLGIYAPTGQLYEPQDSETVSWYRESPTGQILEEGITEAGAISSWLAAATAHTNYGVPMIPFYTFYSMFRLPAHWRSALGCRRQQGERLSHGCHGRTNDAQRRGTAASGRTGAALCLGLPVMQILRPDAGGCGSAASRREGGLHEIRVESGGLSRTALLHVPEGHVPGEDLPLVMVFHGGQGEGESNGRAMVGKWEHLRNGDFVMAFPDGIYTGERAWAGPQDTRDLRFVDDLLAAIDLEVGIDLDRVYAAGFSNGSGFVWMLQCLRAERFAGFGHVQQSMATEVRARCKPSAHVPSIWIRGRCRSQVAMGGQRPHDRCPRTLDYLLGLHSCDPSLVREQPLPDLPGDATHATRTTWGPCLHVSAIELIRISGGTHHWPVSAPGRKGPKPGQSTDIDGADEIVRFWRANAML